MANIIVAFSKPEDGKSIKGILVRSGYEVAAVCMSGSQVLSAAEDLSGGIVVCGYRFEDMMYDELRQCLSLTLRCWCWHLLQGGAGYRCPGWYVFLCPLRCMIC